MLMSATLAIRVTGSYEFQVGTDWGRGGGIALFDTATGTLLQQTVDPTDIWWANNWNNPDVISTTYTFAQAEYTIAWLGFEGCCAGSATIRFAYDGGPFNTLSVANMTPYVVPVPSSVYLFASCLVGLVAVRREHAGTSTRAAHRDGDDDTDTATNSA